MRVLGCMPGDWPGRLPETCLAHDPRVAEPCERRTRPPLVQQLAGSGIALDGAAERQRGRAAVPLGEEELGARLRYGGRPGTADPASCAGIRALYERAAALELPRSRTDRRGGDVVGGRTELADPARVEERFRLVDERERLVGLLGHAQQHAVHDEEQVLRDRRDMRELERLLELGASARAVAEVEQRLAEAHARESLGPDRSHVAAQARRVEQMRARSVEVARKELRLAEHGGGERLAAARARLAGLRAHPLREARETVVRITGRERVLG